MARLAGVLGASLVDLDAGLPWCSEGPADIVRMAEAATDYWRLTLRHGPTFEELGGLRVQVLIHARGRITSVACPPGLLLVTISAEPDSVDWAAWKAGVARVHAALRSA